MISPDDLNFENGKRYTLTAKPSVGWNFAGWICNGVLVSTKPRYSFVVKPDESLEASFVPATSFSSAAGTYYGLFYNPGAVSAESSGSFVATVTRGGAYSAKVNLGGDSYSYSGGFSAAGWATKSLKHEGSSALTVSFQLGLSNSPITGKIGNGAWTAELVANAAIYSSENPAPQAGNYTVVFPGADNSSTLPAGNGYGTATVDGSGNVRCSGRLGDGTAFTSATVVCEAGQWPFFAAPYNGKGSILGWLTFSNISSINGLAAWFKLPHKNAALYPGGFTTFSDVAGSPFHFTPGLPILDFIGGELSLTGGGLAEPITNSVALPIDLKPAARALSPSSSAHLTFNTSNGLFKGSVINPKTHEPVAFDGVVLQNQNMGAGLFSGKTQSGSVLLLPQR
jgi:hypothetical protein